MEPLGWLGALVAVPATESSSSVLSGAGNAALLPSQTTAIIQGELLGSVTKETGRRNVVWANLHSLQQ